MRSRFRQFNWLGEVLLGLVYPPSTMCPLCGESSGSFRPAREVVCQRCQTAIAELQMGLLCCSCCGRFFRQTEKPVVARDANGADWYCVGCRTSQPGFDFARAVGPYAGILREAVHRFKYLGKLSLAEPLGKLMAAVIREEFLRIAAGGLTGNGAPGVGAAGPVGGSTASRTRRTVACVVPVPLHPQRLKERGFNQAELLAEIVAQELKLEFAPRMLARGKHTPSQTRLSREERQLNLRGAFVLGSNYGHSGSSLSADSTNKAALTNQAILIVDDVLTTGSTGTECARVLREATCGPIALVTTATGGNFKEGRAGTVL